MGRVLVLQDLDRQVLGLLAGGDTQKTIARKLGISERTVRRCSNRIVRACGARSLHHAMVIATRLGLLAVSGEDESVGTAFSICSGKGDTAGTFALAEPSRATGGRRGGR